MKNGSGSRTSTGSHVNRGMTADVMDGGADTSMIRGTEISARDGVYALYQKLARVRVKRREARGWKVRMDMTCRLQSSGGPAMVAAVRSGSRHVSP